MKLKTLINRFLSKNGGYPLQSDESLIRIRINDETIVGFEESLDHGSFYLFSVIDTLPHGKELEVLTEALASNLFNKETGQASIGLDKETKTLVLFQQLELAHMDENLLQHKVESFIAHLSYLKAKFEELIVMHTM